MDPSPPTVLQVVQALAGQAGLRAGEPRWEGGLAVAVRGGDGADPLFEVRVQPAREGDDAPCYARTPAFRIGYREGPGLSDDGRRRLRALLDALKARLLAGPLPLGVEAPPAADGHDRPVEARVLETGGGRGAEHLLRVDFRCNQACPFCFVQAGTGRLEPGEAEALLQALPGGPGGTVVLTGGEPTLNPRLADIAARVRALGVDDLWVQTNAVRLADAALARRLVQAGVSCFMVSFHSHRPGAYDAITGSRGLLPRAEAGLRNLAALGVRLLVNVAVNRGNVRHLRGTVRRLDRLLGRRPRRASIFFTMLNEAGHRKAPGLAVPLEAAGPALDRAVALCGRLGLPVEPFFGDCAPPLCALPDPSPVVPPDPVPGHAAAYLDPGAPPPPGGRVKAAACRACRFDAFCRGLPATHARLFGLGALRPFT